MPIQEFFALLWEPPYGECFNEASRSHHVPADYEVWFTTYGPMVDEDYPPESCLHTLCADCTAVARESNGPGNPGGMVVVLVRPLRLAP